jgi:phage tail sheath gpL-like
MVAFNQVPGNVLVPFSWFEINSGGSPYQGQSRLLLVGQKLTAGTATAGVSLGPIASRREVVALGGAGSMLVEMYDIARRNAPFQPIWLLPLADPSGTAATGTITITAPSKAGFGTVEIGGTPITIQILAADTATNIAANLVAAINAALIPVSAANTAGVVTVTSRHVGLLGNNIEIAVPKELAGNLFTAGAVIVAMANGTGTPVLTTPLANLGDDEYDWIAGPYADATSLNATRDFLASRWHPSKQVYGHYVTMNVGNLSAQVTLGNARNDSHATIVGHQTPISSPWVWAAAGGAKCAQHLTDAPELSRPLQTLTLEGVRPARDRSLWWDIDDRQALYVDGIAATRVTVDGLVQIDRFVTTYQVDANAVPDATFRDVETMAQLVFLVRYLKAGVAAKHGRQALADENPYGLQEITTPRSVRETLIHLYRELVALGVTEKPDLFAEFIEVERDGNDATRLNAYLPVDVVNQLRVFAANVTAFLEYRTA